MVGFHVFGGILVILCAWGGGFGHFLKFRECFGHYLGFKGNSVLYLFLFFIFFVSVVHWSFSQYQVYFGHFCGYEGIVVIFSIYRAI